MQTKNRQTLSLSAVQTQRAFWISIGTGAVMLIAVVIFLATNSGKEMSGPVQTRVLAGVFALSGFISAWLVRQNRAIWGIGLILVVSDVVILLVTLSIAGVGVAAAAVTIVITFGITTFVLPPHRMSTYANGVAILLAAVAILLDVFQPFARVANKTPGITWGLTAFLVLIYGFLILRQYNTYTLRTKLIVVFLAVALIPLAVISYITYSSTQSALTNGANQKLAAAASQAASDIDTFIDLNLQVVRTAGRFSDVVDFLLLPADQRTGSTEAEHVNKILGTLSRQDPVFISSVAVFDINGIDVADTTAADIGQDKSNRAYFSDTLASGLPYISQVEHSATSGVPSLYFAAPVRDAVGKIIGVIRIRYTASILQKIIVSETGLAGESSYGVLLDANHIRLAHGSDRSRVFKSIMPLDAALLADLQARGLMPAGTPQELSTNYADFEAGLNNLAQNPYFAADTNGDGGLEQTAVVALTTRPWVVAFVQSQSVFLAPATAQTTTNLLAAFIVALLVGVAGFFFSQNLSGPIIRLTHVAEAIAGGNINIQAKVETADEVGTLADTFNRMTAQLRDFIGTLEQRVAARTKDLATVAEVGTATATILETNRLLQEVVDLTKERFNLYHSHIYLLDEAGENLVLASGAGEPGRQMKAKGLSIPLSREQSLVARAARERKGVIVNDVTLAPDFLPNALLPNTRAELAVPMLVGGNLIGVFDIQSDQVGRFAESDANIQTTLAAQIATSIQNVRAFEQSKAQANLETLVNTIGQKIQRTGTVEETLQTAVREIGLALGSSRVSVSLQVHTDVIEPVATE
jgi:putative methionine-R-sulfoxide reductase with GAF domain